MATRPLPDPELLHKLLDYNPATGEFFWKPRTADMFAPCKFGPDHSCAVWNTKNAGKRAFNHPHGVLKTHLSGAIFGQLWLAHRVAWAMHYRVTEFGVIDHINGNQWDNRICNLRTANHAINTRNARKRKDCSSGHAGVHWHVGRYGTPRWVDRVQIGGKRKFLGGFHDIKEAIAAREAAIKAAFFGPAHGKEVANERPF